MPGGEILPGQRERSAPYPPIHYSVDRSRHTSVAACRLLASIIVFAEMGSSLRKSYCVHDGILAIGHDHALESFLVGM